MAAGELLVPEYEIARTIGEGCIYSFGLQRPFHVPDKELFSSVNELKPYQKAEISTLALLHRDIQIKELCMKSGRAFEKARKEEGRHGIAKNYFKILKNNLCIFNLYSNCYPEHLSDEHSRANCFLNMLVSKIEAYGEHNPDVLTEKGINSDGLISQLAMFTGNLNRRFEKIYKDLNYENINLEQKESLSALEVFLFYMNKVTNWTYDLIAYKSYRDIPRSPSYTPEPKPKPEPQQSGVCVIL